MAGQVNITTIEVNGVIFTQTRPGYYYKRENGKQTRIPKSEWEQAFDEYVQNAEDRALTDDWQTEADEMIEKMEQKQAESDKVVEDTMNKKEVVKVAKNVIKKAKAPRKSKDIAFKTTITLANDKVVKDVTLTTKQVAFIKAMPEDNFFENGLDSTLWIDVFCDTVADRFSPMAVGAMVSTLREKGLIAVIQDRVNGRKCKSMTFTDFGKKVAKELGLN